MAKACKLASGGWSASKRGAPIGKASSLYLDGFRALGVLGLITISLGLGVCCFECKSLKLRKYGDPKQW